MEKKKRLISFLVIGGFLGVVIAMAGIFYWRGMQATANLTEPGTLLVMITKPLNGSNVSLGDTIPVSAEADGLYNLQALEFWVDGALIDTTRAPKDGLQQLTGLWNWLPEKEGEHSLSARGIDEHGQAVLSNIVHIRVGPAGPNLLRVVPKEGDTLAGLAGKFQADPDLTAAQNPGIGLQDPLAAGNPVELPVPAGQSIPPDYYSGPSFAVENNAITTLDLQPTPLPTVNPGSDKTQPPLAPDLILLVQPDCNLQVTVRAKSDNADAFHIYILRPESNVPTLAATNGPMLSGESFQYLEPKTFGTYEIYADAVNDAGVQNSSTQKLSIMSGSCSQYGKQALDIKVITRRTMSKLYCYVTIDDSTYIHVPGGSDSYLNSMSKADLGAWAHNILPNAQLAARSGFDLKDRLPVIYPKGFGTSHIKFQCWDWDGQINLGTIEKVATDDELRTVIILSNEQYDVVGIFGANPYENVNQVQISAPFNLKSTGDPNLCGQHGKYADCELYIKIGMAAFVWDYHQGKCFPGTEVFCHYTDIDGFRIYRQYKTGEPPQSTFGIAGKEKYTAGFTPWPSSPDCNNSTMLGMAACYLSYTPCYTVRAYKGSIESQDSNEVCLGDQSKATGTQTKSFTPTNTGTRFAEYLHNILPTDPAAMNWLLTEDTVTAGYWNRDSIADSYYFYRDYWGLILFDLNELTGKPIQSATLSFDKTFTDHDWNGQPTAGFNCVRALGVSKEKFFHPGMVNEGVKYHKLYSALPDINTGHLQYDVTEAVKTWAQGQLNTGFVFDGRDPFWPATPNINTCINKFGNFKLDVTYFPNP